MTSPRISMLMTVFNGGRFLADAVNSVLASRGVEFEFVLVDNCSTDGSREYLQALTDPRIKLVLNERDMGQTGALNVGLKACSAPYVARLDADDLTAPDRLAWQADFLDDRPDVALVGGQMVVIDSDGRAQHSSRLPTDLDILAGRMIVGNCFDHSSVAFRRDAALAVGCYPEDFAVSQDFALFSALMRAGWTLENLDLEMARVRVHSEQVMGQALGEREKNETAMVIALNLAWATQLGVSSGLGRTVYRLVNGVSPDGTDPTDPPADQAIDTIFSQLRLSSRRNAQLAVFLIGCPLDGRNDLRWRLTRLVAGFDPLSLLGRQAAIRWMRAILPDRYVGRLRRLNV